MIVDFFLSILTGLVGPVLDLLPSDTSAAPTVFANTVESRLWQIDQFVPVFGSLRLLASILAAWSAVLAFRLAVFVWKLVRG
jgi:hypothetical protein